LPSDFEQRAASGEISGGPIRCTSPAATACLTLLMATAAAMPAMAHREPTESTTGATAATLKMTVE
jgi:hypothetical protein